MSATAGAPDLHDVQGLLARGYSGLKAACFLVLGIGEEAAGRRWLQGVADRVTASDERPTSQAVNVAFTSSGLAKLGLPPDVLALFSNEFVTGMTTPHRSRILGDVGDDAPERWEWGGPAGPAVDALLLLYARDDDRLAEHEAEHTRALPEGVRILTRLGTSDLDGYEPFGFRDGISQPPIEGLSKAGPAALTIRFGEFALGYPNEYGLYTDRPLLDRDADPGGLLPPDPQGSGRADLGRNGSYLVFRQLRQDVRGFWRFADEATRGPDGTRDAKARLRLAAKMVGRWPSGSPLALAPEEDDPALAAANDFRYFREDVRGTRCPVGAHIRRANPRDSLDPRPGSDASLAINRRHRILRRGREYGASLTLEEALSEAAADTAERGLHFICLNANIARQFEFVQFTWLNNPKFDGLYDDADPLVGPSHPRGGTFTIQSEELRERFAVPRFVSVRGGAYFFMPGLAATRYLATIGAGA